MKAIVLVETREGCAFRNTPTLPRSLQVRKSANCISICGATSDPAHAQRRELYIGERGISAYRKEQRDEGT